MLNEQKQQDPLVFGLVLCCAFWAPWGPAITLPVAALSASKVFIVFAVLLIGYWGVLVKGKFRPFPKAYNLFTLLVVVHSLVTYGLFHSEEFKFGSTANEVIDETTVAVAHERGTAVARYFLNVLFTFALATAIGSRRQLTLIALAFGTGFSIMLLFSSRMSIDYSANELSRLTGGFLNPNDLGQTAMVVVLLSLFIFKVKEAGALAKGLGAINIIAGVYALLASGSRSSMGAVCIAFAAIMWYSNFSKKFGLIITVVLLGMCASLFLSDENIDTLSVYRQRKLDSLAV